MAQVDTYLVEKLREILQRLYVKNGMNGVLAEQELPSSGQEEQQVAYKRSSSSLFPFAPSEIASSVSDSSSSSSSSIIPSDLETAFLFAGETRNADKYTHGGEDSSSSGGGGGGGDGGVVSAGNYYGTVVYNNESVLANYSDGVTRVNCSPATTGCGSYLNDSAVPFGTTKQVASSEDESSALTRNLHEFIHILKMSLKSGSSSVEASDSLRNYPRFQPGSKGPSDSTFGISYDSISSLSAGATGSTDPFSGIEAASTTDMEFNLTLDDILDLNNLLEDDEPSSGIPLKHVLIIATYFAIACVSIIGNLLVVQLVIRSRRFHTLTHALLANLAAADLFLATFNIPFSAARVIMSEWPFGSFLCRTVPFVQVTSVYATSFTMAVIALDRYQVIMNPLGKRLKCSQGILLVIAIWILSALLSLPYALHHRVVTVLTVRIVKRCQAEFGSIRSRQLLTVATFLAQYLLPLLFTTVSYISIMRRLWYRSSGLGSTTPRQVEAQSRAKRKTIKMLVLTVICFALSWAPINIYHLVTHFSYVRHNSTAILLCHMIAMSSSVYNPFIFCGLNEHFRREAVKWLHCFRSRRSPIVHPGTEINGMLTRADQVCRRNLSTTVIHTGLSVRRSPQQQVVYEPGGSPRVCQRRRLVAGSTTATCSTAAVYMTPRHSALSSNERRIGTSPVVTRLVANLDPRNGGSSSSSPSGYQPELLFLVQETTTMTIGSGGGGGNLCGEEEEMESADELPAEDTLVDEWGSSSLDCRGRFWNVNQSLRDNGEFLSSRERSGTPIASASRVGVVGVEEEDHDHDENDEESITDCGGQLETAT